jgi:hypothetical protein
MEETYDAFGFSLTLLEGMFVLKLRSHLDAFYGDVLCLVSMVVGWQNGCVVDSQ